MNRITTRTTLVAALPLLIALGACDSPEPEVASDWDGTGVGWGTDPVSRIPETSREAQLVGLAPIQEVRLDPEAGFDRLVIEIRDRGMPNYHVSYADTILRDCATGEPVAGRGAAMIHVRLEPAIAHDESGSPLFTESDPAEPLPMIVGQTMICDREGAVDWAVEVSERNDYRMMQLTELNRLVLDVRHESDQ